MWTTASHDIILHLLLITTTTIVLLHCTKAEADGRDVQQQRIGVITTVPPRCMIRAGRQFVIIFKTKAQIQSEDTNNIVLITKPQTMYNGHYKTIPSCFYSQSQLSFYCPIWNIRIKESMRIDYSLKAVDLNNNKTIWEYHKPYQPYKHLFDCFRDNNIRNVKLGHSTETGWSLTWYAPFWTRPYNPKYVITIGNKSTATSDLSKCHRLNCLYRIPEIYKGQVVHICVKSVFKLTTHNYIRYREHVTNTTCTVAWLSSNYKLKVINTDTGEEVFDYGKWNDPNDFGKKIINATTLAKMNQTKDKFESYWKRLKDIFNKK